MWQRRLRRRLNLLIGVVLCWPALAAAQTLQKLTVGYSSPSGNQSVIFMGKDAGSYQKYGLDVELIFIGAGSKMTAAILAGGPSLADFGVIPTISER